MNLDYSAFSEPKPQKTASPLTDIPKLYGGVGFTILLVFLLPANIFWLIISFIIGAAIWSSVWVILLVLAFDIALFIGEVRLLKRFTVGSSQQAVRASNFAVMNGFTYTYGSTVTSTSVTRSVIAFKGVLGSKMGSTNASGIIKGTYNNVPFMMYNLISERGFYIVCEVDFQGSIPHMFLESRSEKGFAEFIPAHFAAGQKISLEGNFNDQFSVYSIASPIDTLTVLAPDVMAVIVDSAKSISLEVVEDRLYMLANFKSLDEEIARDYFRTMDALVPKILRYITVSNRAPLEPTS